MMLVRKRPHKIPITPANDNPNNGNPELEIEAEKTTTFTLEYLESSKILIISHYRIVISFLISSHIIYNNSFYFIISKSCLCYIYFLFIFISINYSTKYFNLYSY